MKKRSLYITFVSLLIAATSCMQKALPPQNLAAPEFTNIKCDINKTSATLIAELNSDNGIMKSGFMFGKNEASLKFVSTPVSDCILSTQISELDPGDYLYYASVSNSRNTIRTKLYSFTVEKVPDSSITTTPSDGNNGDSNQGDNNQGDSGDSSIVSPPGGSTDGSGTTTPDTGDDGNTDSSDNEDDYKPLPPPEDMELPISDDNFRAYLLSHYDSDDNGFISASEAAAVKAIDICTDNIKTLDGIKYFNNIETLNCKGSTSRGALTTLILPNEKLQVLDCSHNNLDFLSIPYNLVELNCRYNNLHIVNFPLCNIKKLDIFGNYISELNLYMLKDLEELICGMNSIRTLDVSQNLKLKKLDCSDSPLLDTVYVPRNHKITEIIAENRIVFKYKD